MKAAAAVRVARTDHLLVLALSSASRRRQLTTTSTPAHTTAMAPPKGDVTGFDPKKFVQAGAHSENDPWKRRY